MNKIILGIDPGIADTGYGIIEIEKSSLRCLDYGSIKTTSKAELPERLLVLSNELNKIIKKINPSKF